MQTQGRAVNTVGSPSTEKGRSSNHRIHLSIPHMGTQEQAWVEAAFADNWLSTVGPNLESLEASFAKLVGLPAVALGTGTAGIHLGYKLLGIGPGDEVITPTLTFAASCNPICYQGARPIFLDSERETWNLDPNLLEQFLGRRAAINRLPKAVSVVHLFGQSADLDAILGICRQYGLPLLEDAAESLGARYRGRHPGTLGDVGVFSFNGNKMITGTSGGMLVSPRQDWVDKARYWSTQARDADPSGVKNYVHSELGYNYRLSNVLAGIVLGQLDVLDLRVQQRRAVFERYCDAFADMPGIEPQPEAEFGDRRWEMGDRGDGAPACRAVARRAKAGASVGGETVRQCVGASVGRAPASSRLGGDGERRSEMGDGDGGASKEQGAGGQEGSGGDVQRSTFNFQSSTINYRPSTSHRQPAYPVVKLFPHRQGKVRDVVVGPDPLSRCGEYRVPSGLETDAHPAAVSRVRMCRGRGGGGPEPPGDLPAQLEFVERRGSAVCHRAHSVGA